MQILSASFEVFFFKSSSFVLIRRSKFYLLALMCIVSFSICLDQKMQFSSAIFIVPFLSSSICLDWKMHILSASFIVCLQQFNLCYIKWMQISNTSFIVFLISSIFVLTRICKSYLFFLYSQKNV